MALQTIFFITGISDHVTDENWISILQKQLPEVVCKESYS